jgi:hypothetical protein
MAGFRRAGKSFGNMNSDLTRNNARLFAEVVTPTLKTFYAKWKYRW